MDAVGSEKATLFGHSEGGNMCILFAATYPERIDGLVLTGDGTEETLAYLQASQSGHVRNASILQLPHHGSSSSTPTVASARSTGSPMRSQPGQRPRITATPAGISIQLRGLVTHQFSLGP